MGEVVSLVLWFGTSWREKHNCSVITLYSSATFKYNSMRERLSSIQRLDT